MDAEETIRLMGSELEKLGIDLSTEEGRATFRRNIEWAQENRVRCEQYRSHFFLLMIGSVAGGVGTAIVAWGADLLSAFKGFKQ